MNIEFNFFIPAENYTYSFTLPLYRTIEGDEVDASGLRHPDFKSKISTGILRTVSEFKEDLDDFVNRLVAKNATITGKMLIETLTSVCRSHIAKFGRLLYVDLLMYVDVYIYVDYAIFSASEDVYHNLYKVALYTILEAFPNEVMFQSRLGGGLYSWAQHP